uniref:G_PROTEIN_RECEP_F1_2 domain-containing protein n=1 Tax=Steinernema glaseri TaxID=37863 RepID=A0A1I7XVZ0_9BILA
MWAVGVGLSIAQYIGLLILVTNRMVILSFNGNMLDKVWSGRVCGFLLFTQFLFPFVYVLSVIYDDPGLYIAQTLDDVLRICWTDEKLQKEYNALSQVILIIVIVFSGIAFAIIGILHVLRLELEPEDDVSSVPHPGDVSMQELEWIVETTSLGSSEEHTSSITPRNTGGSPGGCPSGFHVTIFLFINYIFLSLEAAFTIVFVALPPTSAIVLGNFASLSFPLLMLSYWYGRSLITPWTYQRRDGTIRFWVYRLRQMCYNPDPRFRQLSSDITVFSTSHSSESRSTDNYPATLRRSMSLSQYERHVKECSTRDSYLHRTTSLDEHL